MSSLIIKHNRNLFNIHIRSLTSVSYISQWKRQYTTPTTSLPKPLSGIKVLELGQVMIYAYIHTNIYIIICYFIYTFTLSLFYFS